MIELTLSRETVALLGAKMESHVSMRNLRAGLDMYSQSKVTHVWKDQFNIIHAIVGGDGVDYKLGLDLDFFLASECRCGERFCPHMAAVFFALISGHEKPDRWLADVTAAAAAPIPATSLSPTGGSSACSEERTDNAHAYNNPNDWSRLLDKQLDALYRRHTDRFRIDIFYYTAYKKLCALAEDMSAERKAFFRLYCAIKLMLHAEQHFAEHSEDYPHPYYHRVAADLNDHFTDRLRDAIGQIGSISLQEAFIPCSEAVRALLQHLPLAENRVFQWVDIHQLLWSQLLHAPSWLEAECERLTELSAASIVPSELAGQTAMMAAHLDWMLGRDDAAMRKLSDPHLPAAGWIVSCLDTHAKTESWPRLRQWLHFALPLLRRASAEQFNRALSIWREYARATGDEGSFRNALGKLLPRSYPQYTDYLIKTARYEEWIHFHLLNGIAPAKIDRTQLKQVEQQNPTLVFPIYHHAIERLLSSRNRTAYRETVKLLKRLKESYGLAGAVDRFQAFIGELSARNQRLHAFMEELEKGKLLG